MHVCVIVPAGTYDAAPLIDAIRAHHLDAQVTAVWGGDPQRRPAPIPGARWADLDLVEPSGVGWGRLLAALEPRCYEWARAATAAALMLRGTSTSVLIVRLGTVGVIDALDHWLPSSGVIALERTPLPVPADGLAPSPADLAERGRWSVGVLGVAASAVTALDQLAATASSAAPDSSIGPILQSVLWHHEVSNCPHGLAVGWSPGVERVSLVDLDDVNPVEPWCVSFRGAAPRVLFSKDALTAEVVEQSVDQVLGAVEPVYATGGVAIDGPIRTLMSAAINEWRRGADDALPPDPFGPSGFVDWLLSPSARSGGAVGRYWFEEWASRPDLHYVFPDPTGDDRARFSQWAHDSWASDGRSPLLRVPAEPAVEPWHDLGREPGVNVIGYIDADSGLGDFTRRLHASLDAADVSVSGTHYARTASPQAQHDIELTTDLRHEVNLITVHGDQMRFFADDHGAEVFAGRRNIGYWFWELSELTQRTIASIDMVDEVWAATEFVADAYRAVTDKPVRVVPVPVPEPTRSTASRSDLGLPDGRFVFLVTLDHLSITDRKNPIAAIRAFIDAFPEPHADGPMLLVKTLNAQHRWSEHEQLQLAASARPDIEVVDLHLSRDDQMRLIELSDCLVSLHRSEGLGLHLMEAMWLGTPVIATRYSGNLDFMNDHNSRLIDADLVAVADRQGYYPPTAHWAQPGHEAAVDAMRWAVANPESLGQLADRARSDMEQQPSLAHTGHLIARICREAVRTEEG